jgi:capsular exopolysaccharide synthesis family protein
LDYWQILSRRRGVMLATAAVVVVVTTLVTLLTTPTYKASATLQIERRGPEILTYKEVTNVDSGWAGYQDFYQTQYKILQSRAVLEIAARKLALDTDPDFVGRKSPPIARFYGWMTSVFRSSAEPSDQQGDSLDPIVGFLARGLSIEPVRNSHLVNVSFMDRSPELAQRCANAIASAYHRFSLEARWAVTSEANEFLTKQVAELQAEISTKERQLQELGTNQEFLSLGGETQEIASQALAELSTKYVAAKARLAIAEARYESVRNEQPESLAEVLQSPLINNLKQQYAAIEREYRQMAERFRADWPALRETREELEQARTRLELEIENVARQVRSVAAADYQQALAEVESLGRRVEEQRREVQRVNLDAVEVATLRSEIDTKRTFLNDLLNRQSQTEVSDRLKETGASNIRVVDEARTPKFPIKPRRFFNISAALVLGLMLGIAAALLVDYLDNTIKTEGDIEQLVGLPVLGHLPLLSALRAVDAEPQATSPGPEPTSVASHHDSGSHFAEDFKNLRTSLLLASPDHPPREILVTSCEPGDGKSTIAMNLAIVLTQLGRRVLLIDADLRRPRVHRGLGLDNATGLSSLLTGNAEVESVLQTSGIAKLDAITSGPIPPTPSELLGSPALGTLLDQMRNTHGYDHVILDAPPMLQVADSVILATRTDATIVVVRARKTGRESLVQGVARLRQARARVAGAVLNGVEPRNRYYYRRYRHQETPSDDTSTVASIRARARRGIGGV